MAACAKARFGSLWLWVRVPDGRSVTLVGQFGLGIHQARDQLLFFINRNPDRTFLTFRVRKNDDQSMTISETLIGVFVFLESARLDRGPLLWKLVFPAWQKNSLVPSFKVGNHSTRSLRAAQCTKPHTCHCWNTANKLGINLTTRRILMMPIFLTLIVFDWTGFSFSELGDKMSAIQADSYFRSWDNEGFLQRFLHTLWYCLR